MTLREEEVRKAREAIERDRAEVERLTFAVAEKVLETRVDPAVHGPAVRKFVSERS